MSELFEFRSGRGVIGFWIFAIAVILYSSISSTRSQNTTPMPGAGASLQMQLDTFAFNISNMFNLITNAVARINALNMTAIMVRNAANAANTAAMAAQAAIDDEIRPALENVTLTAGKLVNINKTWKANFKVINSTFMILRKKLSFRAPHIPLS